MADRKLVVEIIGDDRRLGRALDSASRKTRSFDLQVKSLGRSLARGVGFAAAAGGVVAFTAALTDSVKAAGDFELALQKTVGLSGVAQGAIRGLRDDVLKLAPSVGKGPQELADALFFITSSGIPAAKALDVLTVSAKASAAGLGETQVVADAVTSALNAYGQANLSATQATDVLVATVREGKGEADQFAGVIGNVAALAAQLGVSFDQVGAALAAQTRLGTDAETAATQLQRVFSTFVKVTPQSAKAFESVGLDADQLRDALSKPGGLINVLEQVRAAFGTNLPAQAKAFGDVRALRGVLSLVGKQAETTRGIFDRLAKSGGSLNSAFGAVSKTQSQQFARLNASLQVFKVTLGSALAPAILNVIAPLNKWLSVTKNQERVQRDIRQTVKTVIGVIRDLVDALTPLVSATSDVVHSLGGLKSVLKAMVGLFVISKVVNFTSAITGLGTESATSAAKVRALRGALIRLGAIGVIAIGVEILIHKEDIDKKVNEFLRGHGLGFLTGKQIKISPDVDLTKLTKLRNTVADTVGENDLMVKALDKVIARISKAQEAVGNLAKTAAEHGRGVGESIAKATPPPTSKNDSTKKAATTGKDAGNAAKKAFERALGKLEIKFDIAQRTKSLQDDLAILKQQEKVITARLKVTKNDLDLQRQLVSVQNQELDIQKQINENQKTALQTKQFKELGLTPEGDKPTPGSGSLLKRAQSLENQIKGTTLDTSKTRGQLQRIVSFLKHNFKTAGKDVRDAILGMLNDISNALKGKSTGSVQTKFVKRGIEQMLDGLGLSPEQIKELRQRFAQSGPGGTVPGTGVSAFGFAVQPAGPSSRFLERESQVSWYIYIDGEEVEARVTRRQQKKRGRQAPSRRGTSPGMHR